MILFTNHHYTLIILYILVMTVSIQLNPNKKDFYMVIHCTEGYSFNIMVIMNIDFSEVVVQTKRLFIHQYMT